MDQILKSKYKLFIMFIGIFLFLFFLLIFETMRINQSLDEDFRATADSISTNGIERIQLNLERNLVNLQTYTDYLKDYSSEEIVQLQQDGSLSSLNEWMDFDIQYIVLPDGTAYFEDGSTLDVSERNYYKTGLQAQYPFLSQPFINRHTQQRSVAMVAPIQKNGKLVCLYAINFALDSLSNIINDDLYQNNGFYFVTDEAGQIIIESGNPQINSKGYDNITQLFSTEQQEQILAALGRTIDQSEKQSFEIRVSDVNYYFICSPIEINHSIKWAFLSFIPNNYLSSNSSVVITSLIILYIGIFFAALVTFFFLWRMFRLNAQRVHDLYYHDPLTGLYNQNYLVLRQDDLFSSRRPTLLCYFDIARFNLVNTINGRPNGDLLLKKIAVHLQGQLSSGEIGVRFSNDHFLFVLQENSVVLLKKRVEKTVDSLCRFLATEPTIEHLHLSLTAGACFISSKGAKIEEIIHYADMAHRAAKREGGKLVYYNDAQGNPLLKEIMLEQRLHQAFKNHEFVPFIQPQIDLQSGKILGGEALARWIDQDGVLYLPNDFIPLLERMGIIDKMEMEVIRQICRLKREWSEDPLLSRLCISVNLSRRAVCDTTFIQQLVELCDEYQIKPSDLELEITETVYVQDYQLVVRNIKELRKKGFRIAVDDFGAGYSSLTSILDFDADLIKLDQAFLSSSNPHMPTLIQSIITLIKSLHLQVICEGVDNLQDEIMLREFGCDYVQGFFYSKPVSVEEFLVFCRSWSENKILRK